MKRICVITQYYPNETDMIYSFVDQLICQFADQGLECFVISPQSILEKSHKMVSRKRITAGGNIIEIFCPHYVTLPHRNILGLDTYRITMDTYYAAVKRAFQRYVKQADVFYAHFLNPSGIAATILGKEKGIPVYVACGESSFDHHMYAYDLYRKVIAEGFHGVIAVSSQIANDLKSMRLFPDNQRYLVVPNGVDTKKFSILSRSEARKKLGINDDRFIVAFVGHFNERKGIARLIEAAKRSQYWYCIFIGKGPEPVSYERTIFQGPVAHDKLHEYLSAADVFTLPTRAEGCCNAIIEALVSGLPVVSSDLPFNDDILDDECSIRIDPNNVSQLFNAVERLRLDCESRRRMSLAARKKGESLDITIRAQKILSFMSSNTCTSNVMIT